jgi:endonuclease/exonuclease/phosphatase family metal-dependent hydrolase
MFDQSPDVICLTETYHNFLPPSGYMIEAEADYGYPMSEGRRKVLLWSKQPWSKVDSIGHSDLLSGRFIRGMTETPIGPVDVIGVCIPWAGAHVTSGRRDRKRWEDHLSYLRAFTQVVPPDPSRTVIVGDFNQKVPRTIAPVSAYQALDEAILSRLRLVTMGVVEPAQCQLIDHIAVSADMAASSLYSLSNMAGEVRLSDHVGVAATLGLR